MLWFLILWSLFCLAWVFGIRDRLEDILYPHDGLVGDLSNAIVFFTMTMILFLIIQRATS